MVNEIGAIEFSGARLKDLRAGRSQTEIAKAVGISKQALSQIEAGDVKPSADTLLRLFAVLDITTVEQVQKKFVSNVR